MCVSVCVLKIHTVLRQCKHLQFGCVCHVSVFQALCVNAGRAENTAAPLDYHSSLIRLNHFRENRKREDVLRKKKQKTATLILILIILLAQAKQSLNNLITQHITAYNHPLIENLSKSTLKTT